MLVEKIVQSTRSSVLKFVCMLLGGMAAMPILATPRPVQAAWPDRPIKFIVPFAAGGPADVAARILAAPLGEKLGAGIYIENRGGAGGNIGTGAAARSDPDGHTFLATSGAFMLNPSLYEKVPYDPVSDFDPVVEISNSPTVLTAIPALGVRSLPELIALAKNDPDKLNFATPGVGTQGHLAGELLKLRAGIKMVAVNHSGAAPAMQSLLAATVPVGFTALGPAHSHIKMGTLVGLAVTGAKRWHDLPDVPTMVELGFPDFVVEVNFAVYAPANTPAEIVERIARESIAILKRPEISDKLRNAGFAVTALGPAELKAKVAQEVKFYKDVVMQTGVRQP